MPVLGPEVSQALSQIVESVGPSVVRVEGGRRRPTSGVAIAPNRVVTVARGVARGRGAVTVGGVSRAAKVRGVDRSTDLALLEVDGSLPAVALGDGLQAKVGQLVLKLGRPGRTVQATSGIVSAAGAHAFQTPAGGTIDRYLESDAPHQPGFSGGPLVSIDGQVLGIVSTGVVRGVSLVIPGATVARVVAQLEAHGQLRRSALGVVAQPVRLPDDVRALTGDEVGLLITSVAKDGPAAAAGVQFGDTLLHLGGDEVKTLDDLAAFLRADHVGEAVPVRVWRAGRVETLTVTLGARA
ncbi:MAG: PDZ domain-containing protein [Myxococcaceae bacterium]|jgi:S1-C subfamily serine protease|nr:PDZ domain-containing protein [Myxococcaceae bacterium]